MAIWRAIDCQRSFLRQPLHPPRHLLGAHGFAVDLERDHDRVFARAREGGADLVAIFDLDLLDPAVAPEATDVDVDRLPQGALFDRAHRDDAELHSSVGPAPSRAASSRAGGCGTDTR